MSMAATQPTLVILAAGLGSRYGGVKQLDGIGPGGNTILEYSLYDAMRGGFGRVVFVIRQDIADDFRTCVLSRLPGDVPVSLAFQELDSLPAGLHAPADRRKPWGTAHAIWCAREAIDGPFAAINADDFYGRDAFSVLAKALAQSHEAGRYCMVGYQLGRTLSEEGTVSRGVCRTDARGMLTSIQEHTKIQRVGDRIVDTAASNAPVTLDENDTVSMNCWGFTPDFIERTEQYIRRFFNSGHPLDTAECYIPSVVSEALAGGQATCQVLPTSSLWCGVTYPGDREAVQAKLQALVDRGEYPLHLWRS